ncbi:MAG: CheC, inhibitor of methylation [Gemmatimonadetes bacterium]|nr:CheC, inhibitor of methylation [Gemmatimonadota bacterium]
MSPMPIVDMDALTELFNVGLHRAAASLSEVTSQRIVVDLPKLWLLPIRDIEVRLRELLAGELATVHQVFSGAVAGDAVLLIEQDKAASLTNLMTDGDAGQGGRLDESAREVLAEVGNIVLGACLSGFGDMLHLKVTFSVPSIHVDSLGAVLQALAVESNEDQFAVIAATRFRLSDRAVEGYLLIAVGAQSLERISSALTLHGG